MKKKAVVVALIAIAYAIAKIYVLSTPTPKDDNIPDVVKDHILLLADKDSSDSDDDI